MKAKEALIFTVLTALLLSVCVRASGLPDIMEMRAFTDSEGTVLRYRIYIPAGAGEGEKLPLLLYLHGSGHRGDDNTLQVYFEPGILARVLKSEYKNCILVAPQCPLDMQWVDTPWGSGSYSIENVPESEPLHATYELLLELLESEPVDHGRIYVTGLSMGGYGTWDLVLRHPELFAAAVPICGAGDPSKAELIANLPLWIFHGAEDDVVPVSGSREMAKALEKSGSRVYTYSEYPGVGHSSWEYAYFEPELLDWMFSQSKSGAVSAAASGNTAAIEWQYLAITALIAAGIGAMMSLSAAQRRNQK